MRVPGYIEQSVTVQLGIGIFDKTLEILQASTTCFRLREAPKNICHRQTDYPNYKDLYPIKLLLESWKLPASPKEYPPAI